MHFNIYTESSENDKKSRIYIQDYIQLVIGKNNLVTVEGAVKFPLSRNIQNVHILKNIS
jgi:hypothetical protein